MNRIISETHKPIKIWASILEPGSEQQAKKVAELPFIHSHVALMPDAHLGKGSTIGTVIATDGAIIPAAIGVDIGCGMNAVKLPLTAEQLGDLKSLRHSIERSIPTGRDGNRDVSERVGNVIDKIGLPPSLPQANKLFKNAAHQMGSLGGVSSFVKGLSAERIEQFWMNFQQRTKIFK